MRADVWVWLSLNHKRNDSKNENMIRLRNGLNAHTVCICVIDRFCLHYFTFIHSSIFFRYTVLGHFGSPSAIGHLYPPHFRSKIAKLIDRTMANDIHDSRRRILTVPKCLLLASSWKFSITISCRFWYLWRDTHVNAFKLTRGHVWCAQEHVHQFPNGIFFWFILPVLRCSLKCNARWNRVNVEWTQRIQNANEIKTQKLHSRTRTVRFILVMWMSVCVCYVWWKKN